MVKLKNILNYKISLDKKDQMWRPSYHLTSKYATKFHNCWPSLIITEGNCHQQFYTAMDLVCSNTIAQAPFVCKSGKSLMEVVNFFQVGFDMFSTGGNLHAVL